MLRLGFDNSYARLPARFYARVQPTKVAAPTLLALNVPLARELGLDAEVLASPEGVRVLAGNAIPDDAEPIALAYAGHQFGSFAGRLGDGRAILLGEAAGRDVQLKGAGPTPFSRGGDGRAALGPVLREYVVSEAMVALGIPTTRSLAAVRTGDFVYRDEALPGAVLARVAASHVRIGTFEWFASQNDVEALKVLVDYCLARHSPDAPKTALSLLGRVSAAQASLVAQWMGVGFIHGVMNTDNTSISGETLDYGPCAFLDEFDPAKTFSSIDRHGRYAYANQPNIALWNLTRFAECLLPLIDENPERAAAVATEALQEFPRLFHAAHARVFRRKLGLGREEQGDAGLIEGLLEAMAEHRVDFTVFFRDLALGRPPSPEFSEWEARWKERCAADGTTEGERRAQMRRANPAYIPRNHRIEQMIEAAVEGNLAPFEALNAALAKPYEGDSSSDLATPPRPEERVARTFCGT